MISVIPINSAHPLTRHTPLQGFVVTAWSGGRGLSAHLRKHDVFAYAFTHTHAHTRTHMHARTHMRGAAWKQGPCQAVVTAAAVSQGPREELGPRCVCSEATLLFPCDNSHPQSRWPNLDMVQAVRFLTVSHLQGKVKTVEPKGQNTGSKLSTEISQPPFPCVCYMLSL